MIRYYYNTKTYNITIQFYTPIVHQCIFDTTHDGKKEHETDYDKNTLYLAQVSNSILAGMVFCKLPVYH